MHNGFHNRGGEDLPEWSGLLTNYYWRIRVEGRNKALRRKYYRYVAKEKLRLAESGIDQTLILAVCRYLVNFKTTNGIKVKQLMNTEPKQLVFDFSNNSD
jgi:hypothetical protein